MGSVIVDKPKHFKEDGKSVVSATVKTGDSCQEIWYRVPDGPLSSGADIFLAATLFPAMKIGGSLRIAGSVSPRLLGAIPKIQEIFHAWYPEFQEVAVEAQEKEAAESISQKGVGCFFSGGVDAFYSLLKQRDEVTKVIFIHGFDIRLEDRPRRAKVSKLLREAAAELQKPLIEVETNIRAFSDAYTEWGFHQHGAVLVSVALMLSPQFKKIYIPSSYHYSNLSPWGSHPILDPLWSTEDMEIVHDGCEAKRSEKVSKIVQCETVLRSLRVCWEKWKGDYYNCGQCEKCLRTMVSLRILGRLDRCTTFERPLDLAAVSRVAIPIKDKNKIEENLELLKRVGNDPALVKALSVCLKRAESPLWGICREIRHLVRVLKKKLRVSYWN